MTAVIEDAKVLDGTNGGTVPLNPRLLNTQISIGGRSSGVISVLARSTGSDVYEELSPRLVIDLAVERTTVITGYALDSLKLIPNAVGANFEVTISQWDNN